MKCGYVAVLGLPNAGKSSFINYVVGEEVAIVTKRRQTTRNNILGIKTGENYQIIFIDTPGIHHSKNKLDKFMMKNVRLAIGSADVVLYFFDGSKEVLQEEKDYIKNLSSKAEKLIVVMTKADKKSVADFDYDFTISVENGENIDALTEKIIELLPNQEKIFPDDEYTDKSVKFLICENIRGQLLDMLDNEVPHNLCVTCESFDEQGFVVNMNVNIVSSEQRHKGIIIGKKGENLKKIGTKARAYAEELLDKKVNLKLFVSVDEKWHENNPEKYGY